LPARRAEGDLRPHRCPLLGHHRGRRARPRGAEAAQARRGGRSDRPEPRQPVAGRPARHPRRAACRLRRGRPAVAMATARHPFSGSARRDAQGAGIRAMTLISKSKPASQFTPTAVQLGYGASPNASRRAAETPSNWLAGSVWKVVTSTTSSKPQRAAASTADRLSKASFTWRAKSGSGEPSSRLPTWPDTNSRSPDAIAGEYLFFS